MSSRSTEAAIDPVCGGPGTGSAARRVLVVDDNVDSADSLADVVQMLGHTAEVAYDGESAIVIAEAYRPDIVLCDIGLPRMNGYEVAAALRAAHGREVQLVAVSGYAQAEDIRRSVELGFDAHIAKPLELAELRRLLASPR